MAEENFRNHPQFIEEKRFSSSIPTPLNSLPSFLSFHIPDLQSNFLVNILKVLFHVSCHCVHLQNPTYLVTLHLFRSSLALLMNIDLSFK